MKKLLALCLGLSLLPLAANAAEQLGTVDFRTSCDALQSAAFNRGVALLHDFWYEEAQRQFDDILKADPKCAMAHWGVAMSVFHQIWDRPEKEALVTGRGHLQLASNAPPKTARERDYIAALDQFFGPVGDKYEKRIANYSHAMMRLQKKYPDDVDATAFAALSLLAAEPTGDTSLNAERGALALLKPAFAKYPDNPGLVHYIIHACDTPSLASEGLIAARHYGKIAPSGAHAAHMPGHIFARLGLWQEDIDANVASVADAEVAQSKHPGEGFDEFHANEFLLYAYLQSGQEGHAKAVLEGNDKLLAHFASMPDMMGGMSGMSAHYRSELPAFYYLELRDWKSAAALPVDGNTKPSPQMMTLWAHLVADGHLRDGTAAQADLTRFLSLLEQQKKSDSSWVTDSTGARVMIDEAQGWAAFAAGDTASALNYLRQSADLQDKVGQGEVDIPAREMLADMLLELKRPQEALAEYDQALALSPNRFNGLYNAGLAAEAAGDPAKASNYYAALLKATDNGANSARAEFKHLNQFKPTTAAF
jgi:tetratricopeptide (TPR) repeat protein